MVLHYDHLEIVLDSWHNFEIDIVDSHETNYVRKFIIQRVSSISFTTIASRNSPEAKNGTAFAFIWQKIDNYDFIANVTFGDHKPVQLTGLKLATTLFPGKAGTVKVQLKVFKKREMQEDHKEIEKETLLHDLISQFLVTDIVLAAEDGDVVVKKELIIARSSVFRSYFDHDSKENRESRIEMKDTKKEVLEEFVQSMMSDVIKKDSKNALELLILADKYNIPHLKTKAEQVVINNLKDEDAEDVYKVLSKTSPSFLKKLFLKSYSTMKE